MSAKLSIITPTLNAEQYLARTLASIAAQTYPDFEHIVVDAGSVDATAELAAAAGATLVICDGLRQAAAINRGVAQARGEIVVVVNGDDVLLPGALARFAQALAADPGAVAVYGEAVHIDEDDRVVGRYPSAPFVPAALLESCYICHPAAAVRTQAYREIGGMNERLDVALDYDFWIRLAQGGRFRKIDAVVAGSRMHRANKTLARRGEVYREVFGVLRRHYGYVPYTWVLAYASWLLHRNDQFFEPATASRGAAALSLPLGLGLNPRRPGHYFHDWYRHRAFGRR